MKEKIMRKMIDFYAGNTHDIEHFLKVQAYAVLIGRSEDQDARTMEALELAAIAHDIACPLCRQKYGNADGKYQEIESEALLRPFFAEFDLESDLLERIIYLISHHHSINAISGMDHQILIEADFLVNASEGKMRADAIRRFRNEIARTRSGKYLLNSIYLREETQ